MDSRKLVFKETAIILLGEAICVAAMIGIYALLGFYDTDVLLGGIAGAVIAAANFFFMAMMTQLAADRAENQDVEGGKKLLKASYPIRLLVLALVLIACGKSGFFNVLALVLPLVFVRPILMIAEFFRKKGA